MAVAAFGTGHRKTDANAGSGGPRGEHGNNINEKIKAKWHAFLAIPLPMVQDDTECFYTTGRK